MNTERCVLTVGHFLRFSYLTLILLCIYSNQVDKYCEFCVQLLIHSRCKPQSIPFFKIYLHRLYKISSLFQISISTHVQRDKLEITYLLTYLLTPWSRVLLEKLASLQLVKKFPAFYGTRRFLIALTSARHLSLS